MDQGVRAAVSEAYRIFSRYSFGASGPVQIDDGVLGPLEHRLLRLTPPPEIPPDLLAAYTASLTGMIEGTAADDFRALLPRYFELIAGGCGPAGGFTQDALRGLERSEYRRRWPAEEADAVDRLLAALLGVAEARGADGEAAEIRRFMAEAHGDVRASRQEA